MTAAKKKATKSVGTIDTSEDSEYLRTNLAQISCIQYSITFWEKSVLVLLDSSSEVNAIHLTFAKKKSFFIRPTDIRI